MDDFPEIGNGRWLTCGTCHHPLVPVSVIQGRTALVVLQVVVYDGAVVCGKCNTSRRFKSVLVSPPDAVASTPEP